MGYDTRYQLDIVEGGYISDVLSLLNKSDFEEMFFAVDEHGEDANNCKWYDHEDDMKKLSLMFPDIVFDLYGEGDEAGDIWHKYFKNGKMQRCPAKICFDAYDESKLEIDPLPY